MAHKINPINLKGRLVHVEILDDDTSSLDKKEIPSIALPSPHYAFTVKLDRPWSCQVGESIRSDHWGEMLRLFELNRKWRKIARALATTRRGKRRNRHLIKRLNAARQIVVTGVRRGNRD